MSFYQWIESIGRRPPIDAQFSRRRWLKAMAASLAALGLGGWALNAQSQARENRIGPEAIPWDPQKHLLPHFLAHDAVNQDQLAPLSETAIPQAITTRKEKVVLEFLDPATSKLMHLDPVALNYQDWGAHPAEKILWAKDTFGLTIDSSLEAILRDENYRDLAFHRVKFEHRFGTVSDEVVSVVAPDGSYVVPIKAGTRPPEWENTPGQTIKPDWFAVYPGHIIEEQSPGFLRTQPEIHELNQARGVFLRYGERMRYETGLARDPVNGPILGLLPFGVDPETGKTLLQPDLHQAILLDHARDVLIKDSLAQIKWGLAQSTYNGILAETGYRFDPAIFGPTLQDKVRGIFQTEIGYSVYSIFWRGTKLREAGLNIGPKCSAYNFHQVGDTLYFAVRDYDTRISSFYRLGPADAQPQMLYSVNRGIMLSMINPHNADEVLLSVGYAQDHPLFQCLYVMKLSDQNNIRIIKFPGRSRYDRDELLCFDGRYDKKGNIIFNRYGFLDEGGGYWHLNLRDFPDTYPEEGSPAKVKLHSWDHALDWQTDKEAQSRSPFPTATPSPTPLPTATPNPAFTHQVLLPLVARGQDPHDLVVTAKEVEGNLQQPPLPPFAMTVSRLIFESTGSTPSMSPREVLGVMGGWNSSIRHTDRYPTNPDIYAFTESNFNYESSLENRPTGIYRVRIR